MKNRLLALLLVCVMVVLAVPAIALPATAAEANLYSESFKEADVAFSGATRKIDSYEAIPFLFTWHKEDGTVIGKRTVLTDTDYATYNQVLIDQGVFFADDPFNVVLEKYRAYLEGTGRLMYKNNWKLVTMDIDPGKLGNYEEVHRSFTCNYGTIYGVINHSSGPRTNEQWEAYVMWGESVQADNLATMFEDWADKYVAPGEDGKIVFSEIRDIFASVQIPSFSNKWDWRGSGANTLPGTDGGHHIYAMAGALSAAGYMYTVPANTYGPASIKIDYATVPNSTFNNAYSKNGTICIVKNGEAVWPAGAVFSDKATWSPLNKLADNSNYDIAPINEALANLKVEVAPGDELVVCVGREASNGNNVCVDLGLTVTIDKDYVVEFQDSDGTTIGYGHGKSGAAFPALPYAASANGFVVDGADATTLPATITADTVVQYKDPVAGNVTTAVIEKASVSIASTFALNLFVKADPYAVAAGVYYGEDAEEVYGEKQEDGLYKVTIPNVAAKDMHKAIEVTTFQDFVDERTFVADDATDVVPTDVLASYADSDATAAEKALAVAALDYAAAAKAFFGYEAVAEDVAARLAAQDAAIEALTSDVAKKDGGEYTITGMTLVLKDQVTFKAYVMLTDLNYIEEDFLMDYTVAVSKGSESDVYDGFVYAMAEDEETAGLTAVITLGGIAAADFDETYTLTVKDVDFADASEAFEYSVNDYIARKFDAAARDADILRAIYALGVAANNA